MDKIQIIKNAVKQMAEWDWSCPKLDSQLHHRIIENELLDLVKFIEKVEEEIK
jgi:hypothetical protein